MSRHQFDVNTSIWMPHSLTLELWARVESGKSFTPRVDRDINGDGLANDRAYVPDPATNALLDASLSSSINDVLHGAPSYTQSCLRNNAGRLATAGSCAGPWSMLLNSAIRLRPGFFPNDRLSMDVSVINIPAAADALLHGDNVRGWGQAGFVDPVLLQVTGFDAGSNSYRYTVNPSFGLSGAQKTGLRAPFRVTLDAHIALGQSHDRQTIVAARRLQLPAASSDSIKAAVAFKTLDQLEATIPNTVEGVIGTKDAVHLTPQQIDSLWALDRRFVASADSIWTPLAKYMALTHTPGYSESSAMDRLVKTRESAARLEQQMAKAIKMILTPQQLAQYPALFAVLLDESRVYDMFTHTYY